MTATASLTGSVDRPAGRRTTGPAAPTLPSWPAPTVFIWLYLALLPFLAGIPRGAVVPVLRPSEALQLAVTAGLVVGAGAAIARGTAWTLRIRTVDWWLLATATTASILPLLWLAARGRPIGPDELLAAFPLVKYALLYVSVRAAVTSTEAALRLARVAVFGALGLAAVAVGQALGVGPVVEVLGRFYADGVEAIDGGRGTATIGSSIATGAYLSFSTGIALSLGWATGHRRWFPVAAALAVGALASGQAGTVVALAVVTVTVAVLNGRSAALVRGGLPAALVAGVVLWPVVTARLADIDAGSGLPSSWLIRWNNLSELYLPSLRDGGWLLGVSPDAIVNPPDVWREVVYLESGYLWLLWVGGIPLLVAAVGLLISAWRTLGTVASPVAIAARAAVAMMLLLSVIDPHLSLRGGADLFFVLVALGLADTPLVTTGPGTAGRWRELTGVGRRRLAAATGGRIVLREAAIESDGPDAGSDETVEARLRLAARVDDRDAAAATLVFRRVGADLIAETDGPDPTDPPGARHLVWRGVALVAGSLRLARLRLPDGNGGSIVMDRAELKAAARLAERLEIERSTVNRPRHRAPSAEGPEPGVGPASTDAPATGTALRLEVGHRIPAWKRAADVSIGVVALIATAPLVALAALLVRRSSPGPVLFRQIRIGSGGLPFQIHKFRTMYVDNDDAAHREQNRLEILEAADAVKDEDDPRVTAVGRLLRRTSLDELPQLGNVLRGEMSLVGPRPSLLWETELFRPAARRRLTTRPGITGLWQTAGRADVSMAEMLELDLDYVDRRSPATDLRCLAKTAGSVLAGEGAK
ncbi:MAG: sugar transferase [Actinomycetota bacterium]